MGYGFVLIPEYAFVSSSHRYAFEIFSWIPFNWLLLENLFYSVYLLFGLVRIQLEFSTHLNFGFGCLVYYVSSFIFI